MAQIDLPPLNWLRSFEAASRHLSFTGAAGELGMTQSAVSQQIKNLEGYLGTPLFYRRTRVLEITEAGRRYLPVVQEAFAGLATATRSLRGSDEDTVLQVQSNMSFAIFWLAPRLPKLFEQHPWLNVLISTALWDPERTASMADVEIRYTVSAPDDARLLVRDVAYPVCRPGLDVTSDTLFAQHFFDCNGLTANWERWCAQAGFRMPADKRVTYATTLAVSLEAAQSGAGVALGHDMLVQDLLAERRLARPFVDQIEMQEAYYLLVSEGPKQQAKAAFAAWISNEMRAQQRPQSAG